MRDCANCFHRKPVLKEDGTWTAECEKWDCEFQSRENMIEKTKTTNNDLISRSALKEEFLSKSHLTLFELLDLIDNVPTVAVDNYAMGYQDGVRKVLSERPQGDTISRSDIKDHIGELLLVYSGEELANAILNAIDNAPTVSDRYGEGYAQGYLDGSTGADWKGGAE